VRRKETKRIYLEVVVEKLNTGSENKKKTNEMD
jgi:hypothetical protein